MSGVEDKQQSETMAKVENEAPQYQEEGLLDLRTLFRKLLSWWWLILIVSLVGFGKGAIDSHEFTSKYVAKMVVVAIKNVGNQGGSSGGTAGRLIAGLAGVNLQSSEKTSPLDRAIFTTKTIAFAKRLDDKYDFMKLVFPAAWDKASQTWLEPEIDRQSWRFKIRSYLKLAEPTAPTLEDLAIYLGNIMVVSDMDGTPFRELAVTHHDKDKALMILNTIFSEAVDFVRESEREELRQQRQYLEERYNSTRIAEFRQALTNVLANQARKEMLLYGNRPSVARIVESPYVSKFKTEPNLIRQIAFPTIFSFFGIVGLLSLFVLLRNE